MECAKTELPAPWVNHDFTRKILSNHEGTPVSLIKLEATPAVPKGENFMSTLYRTYVEYKREKDEKISSKYLIIKYQPPGEAFHKELHVFENVLPMMNVVGSSKFGNVYEISAKYFGTDNQNTIVLEDLRYLGYKMEDRLKGLNLEQCVIVLRFLARFHGLSKKLEKMNPEIFDIFKEGFYVTMEERKSVMGPSSRAKMMQLASEVETWPKFEHYARKLRNLSSTAGATMFELEAPKDGSFNVLNHGDFWTNNILFQYIPGTGQIMNVRFIDFQLSTISSPALDLQYFITTSCADNIKYDSRYSLLEVYHGELVQTLKDLGLDPDQYTMQDLTEDFEEKDLYGFLVGCFDMSDLLADKKDVPDSRDQSNMPENIGASEENVFKGKRFAEVFKRMLVYYSNKGII
ncbi:hypothetical protein C0J52_25885 [Blattella germanica]|nr:hypothetical protein C0J52_25885 [Blattella germanica]